MKKIKITPYIFVLIIIALLSAIYFYIPRLLSYEYGTVTNVDNLIKKEAIIGTELEREIFIATHIDTPNNVKALYMTSWVAGTPSIRKKIVEVIDTTEINSIIIDIKDYTGKIAFNVIDPYLIDIGASENRISDIRDFIKMLHEKNIYVIGRVSVFQDPHLVSKKPNLAVKKESNKEEVWKDYKGISWLDAGAREVWDYTVAIAKESYDQGFDEINFDYIRFPSDGNMNDIYYPFSEEKVLNDPLYGKASTIENFFKYLSKKMRRYEIPISADLFGMVTTNPDDLNIGQVLERALPHFDFIAPMVYPSHYPKSFLGLGNPAAYPYEVIKYSMDKAVERAVEFDNLNKKSTTTPTFTISTSYSAKKLRPWLQDFDLGAIYTPEMVRKQIQATYDSGLNSWMLWDAANTYTIDALLKE